MFQSHKYKYLGKQNGKHIREHELTDSEFGMVSWTTVVGEGWTPSIVEIGIGIIQEYGKRNLNIAANLALSLVWYHKENPWMFIQTLIDMNKKYNPLFPQYEEDLQKYLLLL
jgi:hypothetical protein